MELTTHPPVPGQLPLWDSGRDKLLPLAARTRRPAGRHICPNPECGYRATGESARGRLREDAKVVWLVPDPDRPHVPAERRYCNRCCPRPPQQIADVECAACDYGGPLLVGALAAALRAEGKVPAAVRTWLLGQDWREQEGGKLLCPDHLTPDSKASNYPDIAI
ncbi:hypothetical protein [Nocardia brasiliensis]|uniref:hypothetical protein n=1 Tax=Nocardia brasiliensis TaxID=37326 RepID=UPI002455989C|nr:hypothetical protein [Nocardia brasiliensis]